MKVKMIKDLNVGHTWIRKGEVLKVRVLPYAPFELSPFVVKPFQVIEGEYSGEEIPVTHCIVLEEEEKTYSEAEYNELKRKLEQANREKELLKEEINELVQERKALLEQIERTVDEQKIQLPKEFKTNRKLDASEIQEIRRWYEGALLRMEDGTDPDGFAKEAIEEVALYLGGAEILADLSPFCRQQIEKERAKSR